MIRCRSACCPNAAPRAHDGHISDISKTIYTIWNKALSDEGLEPAETPDFELYDQRFDAATGRGTVEIWIPVK